MNSTGNIVAAKARGLGCCGFIEGGSVNAMKVLGIVLVVAGILALVYGGFSYTKETHEAKIGPLVLSVTDKERVNVPIWAGVGAIVIGGLLLVFGKKS
jgi:multidrug transporter EmrE-like cation transporter